MIAAIQRVSRASVSIDQKVKASIKQGLLVLLGIGPDDSSEDIEWLVGKIANLRIFNDSNGVMNINSIDASAQILIISQFTLHASTKKGNRPSYIYAAKPEIAIPLYEAFIRTMQKVIPNTFSGEFGADMQVELINDGPVTILIDTKNKK